MRVLSYAVFALTLPAQVSAPGRQPQWLTDLQTIQQSMQTAGLGAFDKSVEQAWRAALNAPQHPQFETAAELASSFYRFQGYDLKAEQVLREALAAVPPADARRRRNLTSQLAVHFESTQQYAKALAIREEMGNGQEPSTGDAIAVANLYERMGEFEKAEAAWREVAARRAAENSRRSEPGRGISFGPSYGGGARNELAEFYARRGRDAEAEDIYKRALSEAGRSGSASDWNGAADGYIAFLSQRRRFEEAIDLARQSIARSEAASDPHGAWVVLSRRQRLSHLLAQAGRSDEALAVQRQSVEAAQLRSPGSVEHGQALLSLADMLIRQNRLEEAAKVVAELQEAGAAGAGNARFHQLMAAQTLARIRDLQKKPEEARELRASAGAREVSVPNRSATVYDLTGPAQHAALEGNVEAAMLAADKAIALAAECARTDPQQISGLTSLAQVLKSKQKEGEARRVAMEALAILDEAPDHPRMAAALGSVTSLLADLGMTAQAERAIERQNRILVAAKGADSLALDSVSRGRIALMQRDSDWAGIIAEYKRMLARMENATGSNSRESLYALREVAWAYPALNDWAEEERVLSTLLERTVRVLGKSSVDHALLLVHMGNRASQNREFDKALDWMDQAIAIARALPDARVHLPAIVENRSRIAQMKDGPPASRAGRWFHADAFQRTDGARLGNAPAGPPAVIRGGPARPPAPAQAQPAQPPASPK